jgi:uncharacterized protein GlcG (DUF336 family)
MKRIVVFTALSLVAASGAAAQNAPAAPQAPQASPQLQVLPPEKTLSLDLALEAAQAALAFCKANNALAFVEVMDSNLTPIVVLGADGARPNLATLARRKAYTVIKKQMSSGDFGKQIGPRDRNAPPIEGDVELITFAGAVPVKRGDAIVAAISVSGPTGAAADEACAIAGLDKIKDRVK